MKNLTKFLAPLPIMIPGVVSADTYRASPEVRVTRMCHIYHEAPKTKSCHLT